MIEPTDEMRQAFNDCPAAENGCTCAICLNHRLAAVFAIVERDWDVRKPLCFQPNPHDWSAPCELWRGHDGERRAEVRKQVHW